MPGTVEEAAGPSSGPARSRRRKWAGRLLYVVFLLVVVELSVSYDGGPGMYGVQLLEFRGDKVARERIYVMDGWDAPEWRAPWRADTPADPPE